jgi:hypothetical protein
MKTFVLKTKDGEVINLTNSIDFSEAITYFSKIKKLSKEELLKIYKVEEDGNRGKY